MHDFTKFCIGGKWVEPGRALNSGRYQPGNRNGGGPHRYSGGQRDVDKAVQAARRSFAGWYATSRADRINILASILIEYQNRADDLSATITEGRGVPVALARRCVLGWATSRTRCLCKRC